MWEEILEADTHLEVTSAIQPWNDEIVALVGVVLRMISWSGPKNDKAELKQYK